MEETVEARVARLERIVEETQKALSEGLGAAAESTGVALHLLMQSGEYDEGKVVSFFAEAQRTALSEMEAAFIRRLLAVLRDPPTLH